MKKILYTLTILLLLQCKSTKEIDLAPFENENGWGYKNGENIVIKPKYGIVGEFTKCGIAAVGDAQGENYYIDKTGKKLDIPTYIVDNFIDDFKEGYARFKSENKFGFINECGEIAIEAKFEFAHPFNNTIAIVRTDFEKIKKENHTLFKGGKYGAINTKGELIIPFTFDYISDFNSEGIAKAKIGDKPVKIDKKGTILK